MLSPNVDVCIYHDGDSPPDTPAATVRVFLQDHFRHHEHTEGTLTHLWNAVLECPLLVDFRDDYPGSPSNSTVYTLAKDGEVEQGYRVVFVERRTSKEVRRPAFLRVYLKRLAQYRPPGETTTDCSQCPTGMAKQWTLAVAGVTASGTCSNCTDLNATYTLTHVSDCTWTSEFLNACGGSVQWLLVHDGGSGQWSLSLPGPDVQYTLADSLFQCRAANTFDFDIASSCNWPATLTIVPV